MAETIVLGDISIDVVKKDIKNVHLSVYPPHGYVRISAPKRMDLDVIRVYAISKLDWIKRQQKKIRDQERETRRDFLDRESHFAWGKRYLLVIHERNTVPGIALEHSNMVLTIRPGADKQKKQAVLSAWYRDQIKNIVPMYLDKWEPLMGVKVEKFFVRRMKTRWGSCSPRFSRIRLNTELAKKPPECLEYVLVHELVHLIEPTHNKHFKSLMDRFLPKWKYYHEMLNRLPVSHEDWKY